MRITGKSVIRRLARPWWLSHSILPCYFQPSSLCPATLSQTFLDSGDLLPCKRDWVSQLGTAGGGWWPPRRFLSEQTLVNLMDPDSLGCNSLSFIALNLLYLAQIRTGVERPLGHVWTPKRQILYINSNSFWPQRTAKCSCWSLGWGEDGAVSSHAVLLGFQARKKQEEKQGNIAPKKIVDSSPDAFLKAASALFSVGSWGTSEVGNNTPPLLSSSRNTAVDYCRWVSPEGWTHTSRHTIWCKTCLWYLFATYQAPGTA